MRIVLPMSGVLMLALTGCPDDKAGTEGTEGTTGGSTGDTTGGTTGDTTGATSPTEGTSDPTEGADCMCIVETFTSRFDVVCPVEIKAEIVGDCSMYEGPCTYDEDEVDAALAFLATGEPGVVIWKVASDLSGLLPRSGAAARDERSGPLRTSALTGLSAECNQAFCTGGLHVVVDDKIFTQTIEQMDLSGTRSPLAGATLKDSAFFTACAADPDIAVRFDCVKQAMTAPDFALCAEGEDLY